MSRVANSPVPLPKGVDCSISDAEIKIKGPKGALDMPRMVGVKVTMEDGRIAFQADTPERVKFAGTTRALVANMVEGVTTGFERKLELVGVGFRAVVQGANLSLSLGFSHPVEFAAPEGVTLEAPTQTEILVRGIDKQRVGQTAAKIRAFRPPEPYKGKGVRFAGEKITLKEAKKA